MSLEDGRKNETTHEQTFEEELNGSEARFRSVFDNLTDALLLTKPDGRIVTANLAAQRMFGMTEEELKVSGRTGILVNDENSDVALYQRWKIGSARNELTFKRKDGNTFTGEATSSLFTDADGTLSATVSIRDITERKMADEALRVSESELARELEDMRQLHRISNLMIQEGDTDQLYDEMLEAAINIMRSDMASLQIYDPESNELRLISHRGFHPDSAAFWSRVTLASGSTCGAGLRTRERVIASDIELYDFEPRSGDLDAYRLSGIRAVQSTPLVSREGCLLGMISSHWREVHEPSERELRTFDVLARQVADIIERKMADEMLKASERMYRSIGDLMPYGIWICNMDGGVVYQSDNFLEMTGMILDEIKEFGWTCRLPPDKVEVMKSDWKRCIAEDRSLWDYEHMIRDRNGEYRTVLSRGIPIKDAEGKTYMWAGMNIDITDRKRVEEELRRSNDELQQFAYVASHDLQEPLRMVLAYLGLLEKRCGHQLSDQAREYTSTAMEGADRMRQLIDDLLTYSRIEAGDKSRAPVDLNKVARTAADGVQVAIEEADADVVIGTLPTMLADEVQMMQVLQNLIGNAIKFRRRDIAPKVEVSAHRHENNFIISVRDNGIGIDPKYADKLFKMFSRLHTRDEYAGSGIGLAVAKKIVERHGGRIWFESEPGKGTTFFFTIPT